MWQRVIVRLVVVLLLLVQPAIVVAQTQLELWANNATSALQAGITDSTTTIAVTTGTGSRFPSPTGSQYFWLTLQSGSTIEIVKCTARSSDTLTCARAQQGTTARAFTGGATVENRITASTLNDLAFPLNDYFTFQTTPANGIDVAGGGLFINDTAGASYIGFGALTNPDAWIVHEATGVLSLRHGSNPQELRVYGRDDFSVEKVYERFFVRFDGGDFKIGTESHTNVAAPGQPYIPRDLVFETEGISKWRLDAQFGNFKPAFDNFFSLGASAQHVLSTYTNSVQGGYTKALTESSATSFAVLTVPSSGSVSGHIEYTVYAADATNTQIKSGQLFFSAVANSSGTVTAATLSDVNTLNPVSTGTLTNTMAQSTGANALTITANAVSSLTQLTLRIRFRVVTAGDDFTITIP